MYIIRDGKKIKLTDEEILAVKMEEHRKDVEYDVEEEVALQLEEGWISFASWAEAGSEYSSEDDARTDFIAMIVEDIIETEELYDSDPVGYRPNIGDIVSDFARDMGYETEEA